MHREFTVTAYLFSQEKVLLIWHTKFGKWLPPGGHLEPNELPHEGAARETLEETGWEVKILGDLYSIENDNATSLPSPYLVLLENIPQYKDTPPHQHIDLIFLASPIRQIDEGESHLQKKWFSSEEIEQLISDDEIFSETKEVILDLFDKQHLLPSTT